MDKNIEDAINELVNAELWSLNIHEDLRSYLKGKSMPSIASWMETQSHDTARNIRMLVSLLLENNTSINIKSQEYSPHKWSDPFNALDTLLGHERYMSRLVDDFVRMAQCSGKDDIRAIAHELSTYKADVSGAFIEMLHVFRTECAHSLPDGRHGSSRGGNAK